MVEATLDHQNTPCTIPVRKIGTSAVSVCCYPTKVTTSWWVAIDKLREGKAAGLDRISAEVLQALDNRGQKIMHTLCQKIWKTGLWPEDWSTSIVLPLHKKGPATVCDNYRLIALISHSSKIMLYILQARLQAFLTQQIALEQAGFVKGRGTREQILNARQLIEKARKYSVPICLCSVDFEKAKLEWSSKNWRKTVSNLRFADDTLSIAQNAEELLEFLRRLEKVRFKYSASSKTGMCDDIVRAVLVINNDLDSIYRFACNHALMLNPNKSCVMVLGRSVNKLAVPPITINGVAVPFVDEAKNLGLILDKTF
ncbi:hypothetical protein ILUMI_02765 [Ignelater luminosus]|uniref:Reverse transcriptase domain-containing protein n=1 Tax=Ignelater luminosus TaxID=2038154 RepID=A0A8K0DC08_IGNLU|nr:hypothetical protein ILUMI_02765 [Ignelater luminosus]